MPTFTIRGRAVSLDPLRLFAIPTQMLGKAIASRADDAFSVAIIGALDEVLSRAFG